MRYSIVFVFILLIFPFKIFAEKYKINLNWLTDSSSQTQSLFLLNGSFDENYHPTFQQNFRIEDYDADYSVIISNFIVEPVHTNVLKNLRNITVIRNEIKIDTKKLIHRKIPYLNISFVPLMKSANNQISRIIGLDLEIVRSKDQKVKKSFHLDYVNNSVLASGKWIKLKIIKSGIYKISYAKLGELGFSNPESVKIYGNGGKMLPRMNNIPKTDDLIENSIYFEKGSDGIFNGNDFLLFYGEGPVTWRYYPEQRIFLHQLHSYSDANYYYLTEGANIKTIEEINSLDVNADKQITSYDYYDYHEDNAYNLIRSGREWYGEVFDLNLEYDFTYNPNNLLPDTARIYVAMVASSNTESSFNFQLNNNYIGNVTLPGADILTHQFAVASKENALLEDILTNGTLKLKITYNQPENSSIGYLDYFDINVRKKLAMSSSYMPFRNKLSVGKGIISEFRLTNAADNVKIWDITEFYNIKQVNAKRQGNELVFRLETDSLREFVAFTSESYMEPEFFGEVPNQNLHAFTPIDYLIITHPKFMEQAQRLRQFHKEHSNLRVKIVTPEEVYNEFSSGKPDVAALRNYVKMLYDKADDEDEMLKYLLLFGDGSYDNFSKNESNTNYILTYQTQNSVAYNRSFVSDDFFGLLDDNEGESLGLIDIGIGRFPVVKIEEAKNLVDKVIDYTTNSELSNWRTILCFMGDDEDNNQHMSDADKLSNKVEENYPFMNIKKIFFDAYRQVNLSVGERYPEVEKEFVNRVKNGALIINYSGHGGELGLAHERVLEMEDIESWDNAKKLPLFVTATCEFSRFDDKDLSTAGERILLKERGGGIALLTTTRIVYRYDNYILNDRFYDHVFARNEKGQYHRLGDIMRLTKINSGTDNNKRNFTLLGDPALQLPLPELSVITDSINSKHIGLFTDTLKALSLATLSGHIERNGNRLNDFNGLLFPSVYDKARKISTLGNDENEIFTFFSQDNILFKGKTVVSDGQFSFSFIVPKDIMYNIGNGRISYYGYNNEFEAAGAYDEILIGGSSGLYSDSIGPSIELYLNDENFINGGITGKNPAILALFNDSSGINTSGTGIGHDIAAVLDSSETFILNDYYEADVNSFKSGKVNFRLPDLEPGHHNLTLKAWDVANNSSTKSLEFVVLDSKDPVIERAYNYPNPFTENTAFYFEHNQAGQEIEVLIQIYTVSGKLVKTIQYIELSTGYRSGPVFWNGLDDFNDKIGRGIYVYKISLRANGKSTEEFEKLVILK
ncbi:type IX secretion system sortase PorU [Bacteroidota bacterium]